MKTIHSHAFLVFCTFATLFMTSYDASASLNSTMSASNSNCGCTDPYATNFDPTATYSDNSCIYSSVDCADCDYIIEPSEHFFDNDVLNLPAGSVIGIRGGQRVYLDIRNFHGTDAEPFIFTNCSGKAIIDVISPESIRIQNSSHIRLTGTGSQDTYGIEIIDGSAGVRAYLKSSDLEIDHLDVSGVGVGIWTVTRPTCDGSANLGNFVQKNTIIHHNYVHDVHGEGMYLGGSKWEYGYTGTTGCTTDTLYQAELIGVRVFNNLVENTGWDGIQVGGAVADCEVYNNVIENYGLLQAGPHQAGLMINPGTVGKFYANLIKGGTGNAMHIIGFDNLIYSNTIIGCQMNAIHVGDRNPPANKSYRILNNTIIDNVGRALHFNSTLSENNVFYNNFMANITDPTNYVADNLIIDVDNNILTSSVNDYPFEDISTEDFTPTLTSHLLDSGKVYVGDTLFVDALMRERLVGSRMDIGSFENQEDGDLNIVESNSASISVFPVPTNGRITFKNLTREYNVTVYNMLGERVKNQKIDTSSNTLNVSGLPKGTYIIDFNNNDPVLKFTKL